MMINNYNTEELSFFNIYIFFCKKIISRNYSITEEEINIIFNYLENSNAFNADSIQTWDRYSIQKQIFKLTIFFLKTFKNLSFEDFNLNYHSLLKNEGFSSYLINAFSENIYVLYHIYLNSNYVFLEQTHHFFKDNNFEFYLITTANNHFTKSSYFLNDVISFRFILNGSIKYKKNILCSKGDLLITGKSFCLEEYTILTPVYSEIIFIIKSCFIAELGINIPDFFFKKLPFSFNKKKIDFILKKEPITIKNYLKIKLLAVYLLNLIINSSVKSLEKDNTTFKNTILNTISKNIQLSNQEIVTLLLEKLEVSSSKLYKLFKIIFETTPSKTIQNLKIDHACFLILSTKKTIEEISYLVGYNESIFYKKFNQTIGMTPLNFKKQYL